MYELNPFSSLIFLSNNQGPTNDSEDAVFLYPFHLIWFEPL